MTAPERASSAWESARANFGFLAAVGMLIGVPAGFALPTLYDALELDPPVLDFVDRDVARSLLQTVATATVSVTGLSFSVTIVAFTLASSQLSPRVLRTFSADRLSQATLGCFLGTFVYCLAVLVRLGSASADQPVPHLSVTLAVVLAFVAFALFALFIAHIVRMLQPSSIIEHVSATGRRVLERPYPSDVGADPEDDAPAEARLLERCGSVRGVVVRAGADTDGYVATFLGSHAIEAATAGDGLVVQRVCVGEYVWPGMPLAEVWTGRDGDAEALAEAVRGTFVVRSQQTPVQDPRFPIRQLADIALKGVSPSVNDPTTAINAMEAMTSLLIRSAASPAPSRLRADEDGEVRLVAVAPDLDDLVRLGFEQVRVFAAPYPVLSRRLIALLKAIDDAATDAGRRVEEPARQAALVAAGPEGRLPTGADVSSVRDEHARRWSV